MAETRSAIESGIESAIEPRAPIAPEVAEPAKVAIVAYEIRTPSAVCAMPRPWAAPWVEFFARAAFSVGEKVVKLAKTLTGPALMASTYSAIASASMLRAPTAPVVIEVVIVAI